MKLPLDFFRDEVRCGFYIPTAIKQAWGAQLTILAEIDRVCEKHGIAYYAEWGTLLGAVRHRGFIPWDDDLDIGMKREDYDRFRAVADDELPQGFVIHDYERQENHWLFLSRVVNRARASFDVAELEKWHNYPWLAGVDIFVQDYCYRDQEKEQRRRQETLKLIALADGIVAGQFDTRTVAAELEDVSRQYGVAIDPAGKPHDIGVALYRLAERRMAETPAGEADRLVQMFPWGLKGAEGLPKSWYDDTVRLPFEMTTIPVPAAYGEVVKARYGPSCMEVRKVWSGHDYPSFEGQRENLQKVADFPLPGFRWDPRMLEPKIHSADSDSKSDDAAAGAGGPRREVLFLPIGVREWRGMASCYEKVVTDPDAEAVVVPLPLLEKNALGEVSLTDEELLAADRFEEYPPELPLVRWFDYDPAERHPARIVIQNPYDGENPCLTVPPDFYAEHLRNCTEELVYLPAFRTDEFRDDDRNDLYNLKHYVTAPGVIWADRVIVQSENIRRHYIQKLTAFAGEDTRALWERRIQAVKDP